jgi:hypothetical protein
VHERLRGTTGTAAPASTPAHDQIADRRYVMDGAVVTDALFRVCATSSSGNARLSGIAFQQHGCRIHA